MFSFKILIALVALAVLVSAAPGDVIKNKDDCVCGILDGLLDETQEVLGNILALLGGAPGGLGLPEKITKLPDFLTEFLEKLPAKLLPKVVKILTNTKLTVEEATENLIALLKGKVPQNLIAKLLAAVAELVETLLNGIAKILGNLGEVFADFTKIIENKNQTIEEQAKALEKLKKQFPIEVDAIFFIAAQIALQGNATVSPNVSA